MANKRITDLPQISEIVDTTKFYSGEQVKDYVCTGAQFKTYMGSQEVLDRLQTLEDKNQILEESFIGTIQTFSYGTLPENYLACDGSEVLKADYVQLYTKIGDTFGNTDLGYTAPSDGTKFRVPNLLDQFIRNIDGARALGTMQTDTMRKIVGESSAAYNPDVPVTGVFTNITATGKIINTHDQKWTMGILAMDSSKGVEGQEGEESPNVGSETAPKNTTLIFGIKAK